MMRTTRKLRRAPARYLQAARDFGMLRSEFGLRAKRLSPGEMTAEESDTGVIETGQATGECGDEKGLWDVAEKPEALKNTRDGINVAAYSNARINRPVRTPREPADTIPPPPFREK